MNRRVYSIFTAFFATALLLTPAKPCWAQVRGGVHPGAVGGYHPGGLSPAIRPLFPQNVPAPVFGTPPGNAYRPNGGYIPFVGYYLPDAAPRRRPSFPSLGSFGVESKAEENPIGPAAPRKVIPVVQPEAAARVTVRLPADAKLWFGGTKVESAGAVREFRTPILRPGRLYDYEVRASWKQGGRAVTRTQQVIVTAGSTVRIEFTPPGRTAP
jgi:uncharacterized protein (TIGR03000 family)